jgi:hypothetical protein
VAIRTGERWVILVCSPYAKKSLPVSPPNKMRVTAKYSRVSSYVNGQYSRAEHKKVAWVSNFTP